MMTPAILILLSVIYFVDGKNIETKTGIGIPVSVSFEFPYLTLNWGSYPSTVVELNPSDNCLFEGHFEDEPASAVLVTGCNNASFGLQLHSEKFQDMMFSTNNGTLVALDKLDEEENHERSSRSLPDSDEAFSDYISDFNFYDEFYDVDNAEVDEIKLPTAPLVLHVNVYLDIDWLKYHRAYAEQTAIQVIKQASLILQHRSLHTKIELVPSVRMYRTPEHAEPNKRGFSIFEKHLQQPFYVGGSPVSHLLLTADDDSIYFGVGRLQSVCSSQVTPMAISKWVLNSPRTALTLAHEIGHILGMHHDFRPVGEKRGTCGKGKKEGTLIMNYGEPREIWSECSNQDFKRLYEAVVYKNGKFCLKESETKSPTTTPAPADRSGWGEWEGWSQCSKSCGAGKWTRTRYCVGNGCRNKSMSQERFCNTHRC